MMHHSPRITSFAESSVHTPQVAVVSGGVESVLTSPSPPGKRKSCNGNVYVEKRLSISSVFLVPHRKRNKSLLPSQPPNSSRASVVLPLLTNASIFNAKRANDDNICE